MIGFENLISEETVQRSQAALGDPALVAEMTGHNYELGRCYYYYRVLENHLAVLMHQIMGI